MLRTMRGQKRLLIRGVLVETDAAVRSQLPETAVVTAGKVPQGREPFAYQSRDLSQEPMRREVMGICLFHAKGCANGLAASVV